MTVKTTEKRLQAIPQDRRKNPERENKIKIKRNQVVPHRVLLQLSYISDSQNWYRKGNEQGNGGGRKDYQWWIDKMILPHRVHTIGDGGVKFQIWINIRDWKSSYNPEGNGLFIPDLGQICGLRLWRNCTDVGGTTHGLHLNWCEKILLSGIM